LHKVHRFRSHEPFEVHERRDILSGGDRDAVATRTKKTPMPKYFGALTIVLLLGMVLTRVFLLKRQGIRAMKLGSTDKTDLLIPPFAFFYFYVLFAAAFDWPNIGGRPFFHSEAVAWTGVLFCLAGLFLFLWSLISFRQSFRIGIDTDHSRQAHR
jgi:protein-S-isoprenylcysteine O-methyltransferase Ste14